MFVAIASRARSTISLSGESTRCVSADQALLVVVLDVLGGHATGDGRAVAPSLLSGCVPLSL